MEWKAFAVASNVDPIPRSLFCFKVFFQFSGACLLVPIASNVDPIPRSLFCFKVFFQFSGACLLVPKPFCRRLEDAQGRFSFASAQ